MCEFFFLASFLTCSIAGCTYLLREKNGSDIRVVWYLVSLTTIITFGVAWVAINAGAIENGQFVGEYGVLLNRLISFMIDLKKDFLVVTAIASLVIVPQLTCYIFSGLSGNAKSPMLMSWSLSFLIWGMIKSLVVCGSILISLGVLCLRGYLTESTNTTLYFFSIGLYLWLLAFGLMLTYRQGEQLARWVGENVPCFKALHIWFTRNEQASVLNEEPVEVDLLDLSQSLMKLTSEVHRVAHKYELGKSKVAEVRPE